MPATLVIARLTFREAARRKILLAALVLGLVFLGIYGLGFNFVQREAAAGVARNPLARNEICNFLAMAGLYVVNFLLVMMTVLTSVDTVSGEIASGTMQAVAAKPLRRREILLGKWLGFAGMMTLYLALMAGGVMAIVHASADYVVPHALRGFLLLWLNGLLLLSLSLLGGTVFSTLTNGVLVFGLYGIAFIGGWIEHVGSFMRNQTAVNVGVVASLIFPAEALWRRAAHEMQSPLVAALGFTPFTSPSVPSPLLVGYAALYAAVALALAAREFARRDL